MVLLRKQGRTRRLESRSLRINGKEGTLQIVKDGQGFIRCGYEVVAGPQVRV